MPRIYVLKESIKDPVVTKANLTEYEASVDARFDVTATNEKLDETKKQLDNSLTELESRCGNNIEKAKEEIKGLIENTKTEMQKIIDGAKEELQQNDNKIKQDIMNILEEIKVKASEAEPEEAEDFTVWFDIENKLVKVRKDGQWIPMGAVYQ